MSLKERLKQFKPLVPAIFIVFKDTRTPRIAKIFAFVTVLYALSPIDFIPDFIPILGYLDDVLVLPLLVTLTIKFIPDNLWQEAKEKSKNMCIDGKQIKWYYAIPVFIFWLFIILVVIKIFIH